LKAAREGAGFETATQAAEAMRVPAPTYLAHENGSRGFPAQRAKQYADFFRVSPEWLLYGKGGAPTPEPAPVAKPVPSDVGAPVNLADLRAYLKALQDAPKPTAISGRLRPINRRIPVMGEVAAGLWREAPARQIEDAEEYLALDVPGYERAQLTALRVVGASMDLVYPPGRYVVIAHPAEAGLRVGDYVVVERQRADLVELTIKEFVSEGGRIALWPRSSDPKFQEPIYLKGPGDEHDQSGVQIVGVVVADYGKRDRPPIEFHPTDRA
jgi:SOS-response transcriptional repressor LexA